MDIEEVIRTILEKNPGLRAKYLIEHVENKTGLSRSTIYQHIYSLNDRTKIERKRSRYWWGKPTVANRRALKHSKRLLLGLDAILSEGHEGEDWAVKNEAAGGKELKRFAEQHLEEPTYLSIFNKLKEYRTTKETLRGKLEQRGYPRRVVALFVDGILPFPKNIEETRKLGWVEQVSKEFEEDLERKLVIYSELKEQIDLIKLRVTEMGLPLKGKCRMCSETDAYH